MQLWISPALNIYWLAVTQGHPCSVCSATGRGRGKLRSALQLAGPSFARATCALAGGKCRVAKQGTSSPWAAGRACPVSSSSACCSCTDVRVTVEALKEEASINTAGMGCFAGHSQPSASHSSCSQCYCAPGTGWDVSVSPSSVGLRGLTLVI